MFWIYNEVFFKNEGKVVSISVLKVFMTQIEWNGNHVIVEKAILSAKLKELINFAHQKLWIFSPTFGNKLYS